MNFKFGVLFAKDGQLTDDEMFSNGEQLLLTPAGGYPALASLLLRETLPLTALPTADTGYLIGISNIRRQFAEFYKAAHDQFHSFAKFFTIT